MESQPTNKNLWTAAALGCADYANWEENVRTPTDKLAGKMAQFTHFNFALSLKQRFPLCLPTTSGPYI